MDRRDFLRSAAVIGSAAAAPSLFARAAHADGVLDVAAHVVRPEVGAPQPKPLRILILGGTGFIGPNQVRYALDRKHTVTLFNRGKTNADLFPDVPRLVGDRNAVGGHDALKDGTWDVVIDNPTSNPAWVRDAGVALKGRAGHYLFVSTISVFNDNSKPVDENGPLHTPSDINAPYNAQAYGQNKVRCEQEARAQFGENVTIIRPGLIVGPGDLSDRFSYWPVRIDKGGEVLAPGTPNDPAQYVDARDLSEWIVRLAEQHTTGTFNATGPKTPTTTAEMLYGIKAVTTSDARFTWVPAEFLAEKQVRPWSEMPVWVPPTGATAGFMRVNCGKAWSSGLTFRPLADTARDTLTWYHQRPTAEQEKARAGLAPEKEKAVLAAWRAKQSQGL
jgi:2'-hydroxyisoflavone reductase